jgi:hypothetical protein
MTDSSTLKIITKAPQIMALFAGGFSVILGFVVMVAWHIHFTPLIQVLPDSPPMRYNTALAFFISGWALLALMKRWRSLAAGLSLLVALIGALTQNYIFDAVASRVTGKPWVFDFCNSSLEKSQHYSKT